MGLRAPFLMCNEGYKRNNVKHKENSKTAWDARNKTLWVSHLLMFSPSKEQGWWCKQDVGGFVDIYEQVLFSWSQFWSNWHLGDCWALEMLLQSGFGFTLSSEPDLSSSFFMSIAPKKGAGQVVSVPLSLGISLGTAPSGTRRTTPHRFCWCVRDLPWRGWDRKGVGTSALKPNLTLRGFQSTATCFLLFAGLSYFEVVSYTKTENLIILSFFFSLHTKKQLQFLTEQLEEPRGHQWLLRGVWVLRAAGSCGDNRQ